MGTTTVDAIDLPDDTVIFVKDESGLKGVNVVDEEKGIVEAFVSVTGIKDRVNDIIEPGAYKDTLANRTPKGLRDHDWKMLVSKVLEIKEIMPGEPGLPSTLPDGKPWPAEAGALYVKAQYNLNTERGRDAYADAKFFGSDQEWSIGYSVPKTKDAAQKDASGVRRIKRLDLFEYSQVLWGAMPHARTASVKSEEIELEIKDGSQTLKKPVAMDDGSYPIKDAESLHSAIKLNGHGKGHSKAQIQAHIRRCAGMLGMSDAIPDSWEKSDEENQETKDEGTPTVDLNDVVTAFKTLAVFLEAQKQLPQGVFPLIQKHMIVGDDHEYKAAAEVVAGLGGDLSDGEVKSRALELAAIYDFALKTENEETIRAAQNQWGVFLGEQQTKGVDVADLAAALLALYPEPDDVVDADSDAEKDDKPDDVENKDDNSEEVIEAKVLTMSQEDFMAMLGR